MSDLPEQLPACGLDLASRRQGAGLVGVWRSNPWAELMRICPLSRDAKLWTTENFQIWLASNTRPQHPSKTIAYRSDPMVMADTRNRVPWLSSGTGSVKLDPLAWPTDPNPQQ